MNRTKQRITLYPCKNWRVLRNTNCEALELQQHYNNTTIVCSGCGDWVFVVEAGIFKLIEGSGMHALKNYSKTIYILFTQATQQSQCPRRGEAGHLPKDW